MNTLMTIVFICGVGVGVIATMIVYEICFVK